MKPLLGMRSATKFILFTSLRLVWSLLWFLYACELLLSLFPVLSETAFCIAWILGKGQLICVNLQSHLGYFSPCLRSANSCLDSRCCSNEIFPRQPDLLANPKGRGRETVTVWISSIRHLHRFQNVISSSKQDCKITALCVDYINTFCIKI